MDAKILDQMKALLEAAYEAGRRAGAEEMRAAILAAASGPRQTVSAAAQLYGQSKLTATAEGGSDSRAPRGLLREAMKRALRETPGLTEVELQEAVARIDTRVSPRSVGGELRRMRDKLYRQDGRKWSLVGAGEARVPETETLAVTS